MNNSIDIKKVGGDSYYGAGYNFQVKLPFDVKDEDLEAVRECLRKAISFINKYIPKNEDKK